MFLFYIDSGLRVSDGSGNPVWFQQYSQPDAWHSGTANIAISAMQDYFAKIEAYLYSGITTEIALDTILLDDSDCASK